MAGHIFVDETKARGYLLVVCTIDEADLARCRSVLRRFILRGQRQLHMADEHDSRQRAILPALKDLPLTFTIYDAGKRYRVEREARLSCLNALIIDAANRADVSLSIERDESLVDWERQRIFQLSRVAGCREAAVRTPNCCELSEAWS